MSHLESIEMVKTKDGSLFDSEKDANYYITDDICAEINEIIKKTEIYDLRHADLVKIITALAGNIDNAKRLKRILDKHFD